MKKELLKLQLGLATEIRQNKDALKEGFQLVDHSQDADIRFDLLKFPWPLKTESVEEIASVGYLSYVPGKLRERFMEEVYRILIAGGKATFVVPYWTAMRAVQDCRYEWPPWCEASFLYFDKQWRKANRLEHRDLKCDFEINSYGYTADNETAGRSDEVRQFWVKHYLNSASDLNMTLIKRK